MHDTKDTFFHFTGVGATEDHLFASGEVNVDRVLAVNVVDLGIRAEFTCVDNGKVGAACEVFFNLFLRRTLKHIFHEQSVIRSGCDDTGL